MASTDVDKTSEEDGASKAVVATRKRKKPQRNKSRESQDAGVQSLEPLKRKKKTLKPVKRPPVMAYNIDGVLVAWDDTTDYGKSFRSMTNPEQQAEMNLLNKGAAKGLKGLIKNKLLIVHYKSLVADRLKAHLVQSRVMPSDMFHAAPKPINLVTADPSFISVGEWVEVDADRTPGYNSDGGIAVIIGVHDDLVDVK